ncbi:MAG: ribosomal protein S18-alanine N-acetyltransferase [Gammaproteobacteria bacterium]
MSAVLQSPVIQFRPMHETDLAEVMVIEQEAYVFPWSPGIFYDCLRVGYCCWVLEQDGVVDAYAVMSMGAGESHILNLCVRPTVQRSGLGGAMLRHLLMLARKYKADCMLLEVRPSNRAALCLYRSAGFDEVGMRRRYYPATRGREDALILARNLE